MVVSRWLWAENRTFLEVASMVVTWWIVAFLPSASTKVTQLAWLSGWIKNCRVLFTLWLDLSKFVLNFIQIMICVEQSRSTKFDGQSVCVSLCTFLQYWDERNLQAAVNRKHFRVIVSYTTADNTSAIPHQSLNAYFISLKIRLLRKIHTAEIEKYTPKLFSWILSWCYSGGAEHGFYKVSILYHNISMGHTMLNEVVYSPLNICSHVRLKLYNSQSGPCVKCHMHGTGKRLTYNGIEIINYVTANVH